MNEAPIVATNIERTDPIVPMSGREILSIASVGALVGAIVYGVFVALVNYVFRPAMCHSDASASCAQADNYAFIVAAVLGFVIAMVLLVRVRTYRPLLVAIGATIATWGLANLLHAHVVWYIALLVGVVVYGLCYSLFAWLARLRSFIFAAILTIVIAALSCWLLHS